MVLSSIFNFLGSSLVTLGLGSQLSRALALGTIGFGVQYAFRPGISYVSVKGKNGKTTPVSKQFVLLNKDPKAPTTYMPWYFWPLLFAIIGAFFL
jgi:hypothetical protein